ncbi:peptidoglycan-binding protein LysM [Paracoccus sp. M683]|uniref:peptidoglycan-binding protein LysM n=1 Tax=Paracoccus sp. M683 TaxID=2594268 RepID=UPI00117DBE1F|nr:peptidoglycan-binding protein LysM [Paracoccus sp. M683]TRW97473.1 peptidoglycan-binding protein LysM [Paracoccus sp. M683]
MALWDFVKDAGKSLFGSEAEAAEAQAQPGTPQMDDDTKRKVAALEAEVKRLGLDSGDVHLRLRGDTVIVEAKSADRETMEKLILAVGNIKGIAKVEADLPEAPAAQPAPAQPSAAGADAAKAQPAAAASPAAAAAKPVFHTVAKGETLSAIAKKYLGNANAYSAIFEANRPMLSDPDKIYPGQVLRIPPKG